MIKVAIIAFICYALFAGFVYFVQEDLLYVPQPKIVLTPADERIVYEDIYFTTKDNIKLHGWFIPSKNERAVVLLSHGNAGNISDRLVKIKILQSIGLTIFIYDYRGYGLSQGSPTEQGTYLDAKAAWNYLVETKGIPADKIVLYGESLGAAITVDLALSVPAAAVILEAGFTSLKELVQDIIPILPAEQLCKYDYASIEKISKLKMPKLIMHSMLDEIVPFKHGERLFEQASQPKEFLEIKGGHNDAFYASKDIYTTGIISFLNKYRI